MVQHDDPDELVIEGLSTAVEMLQDADFAHIGGRLYRELRPSVASLLHADDEVTLAVPVLVRAPGSSARPQALAIFLADRLILTWRTGTFKKKPHHEVFPLAKIKKPSISLGTAGAPAATVLRFTVDIYVWECVLPQDKPAFADHLLQLLTAPPATDT